MHAKRHPIRMEYWAGCDADGRLTALQRPRRRRLGRVRLRRHEGAGARRRPRQRAVPRADDRRGVRSPCAPTTRSCGAFRGFGANQAQFAMEGVHRPAGRAGRHQRLGDPQAQRHHARARCGARARSWTTAASAPRPASTRSSPHYDAARAGGQGRRPRPRPEELRPRQRLQGDRPGASCASASDGTVEVRHCWTEMGQGVHTVALQVAVEELGVDPDRIRVVVDTTRELGVGQTTGVAGHAHGARPGRRRGRGRDLRRHRPMSPTNGRRFNVGVVGATGQVGVAMRQILAERNFPVGEIRFFASERSAGTVLPYAGGEGSHRERRHRRGQPLPARRTAARCRPERSDEADLCDGAVALRRPRVAAAHGIRSSSGRRRRGRGRAPPQQSGARPHRLQVVSMITRTRSASMPSSVPPATWSTTV